MIRKFTALATMSPEISPMGEKRITRSVKQEVISASVKLLPFNITPIGDVKIEQTEYFDKDNAAIRATQKVGGHWLDFLHARRAGVLAKWW